MSSTEQVRVADEPAGTVRVVVAADGVRVILTGEIDVELEGKLDDAAHKVREHRLPVVVDATRVSFLDSTGVRFLARFYGHGSLTVAASPTVRFLLEVLGMSDVLVDPGHE